MIDFVTDPVTFVSRYQNRSEMHLSGWEVDLTWAMRGGLLLEAGLEVIDAVDADGLGLVRRPDRTVRAGIEYVPAGPVSGSLRVRRVGERSDLDFSSFPAERTTLEAVTLLEGHVSVKVAAGAAVRLRVEDLTDAGPEWVWGYGSRGRAVYAAVLLERHRPAAAQAPRRW
jgi:outer membrane cobalamin receptor